MSDPDASTIADALSPLLPEGAEIRGLLDAKTLGKLENSWRELAERGFEVGVGSNELKIRHRASGFETVIQLSRPDDLGELRGLFLSLRHQFGRLRDRWLPWLFLPGPAVTVPYDHLRLIISTCQRLRQGA